MTTINSLPSRLPLNNNAPRPTTSDTVAKNLTRGNYKIKDKNRDGRITVSYKFFTPSDPTASWLKNSGAREFSNARKAAFKQSIQAWEDVVKVKFTENAKQADAFFLLHGNPGVGGYAVMPNESGQTNIGIGTYNNAQLNSSMIHELGHSLGLEHPNQNYPENNHAYTAMSYNNKWWRPADQRGVSISESPSTPMMHDIAAIQRIYEPNYDTRKGDTTYGFNSNSEREHYSLTSAHDQTSFCVWDGGGNDTLDFSGFKQDQTINLNAEALSDVGGRRGNVSIAKGVEVENAVGGSGSDVLIGNHLGNRLAGGLNGDELVGGGGADTFVYNTVNDSPLESPDTLRDFVSGTDKIDLSRVLKEAGIRKPIFTKVLTDKSGELNGWKGELLLDYDEDLKMHRLILDVSGKAESVLVILSKNPIKPEDILVNPAPNKPLPPRRPTLREQLAQSPAQHFSHRRFG